MNFLRRITDYGTDSAGSISEKRSIILSNYVSIIGCAAMWILIVALVAVYGFRFSVTARLVIASLFFFAPIALNRSGFVVASRILVCSLIPILVFGVSILDLKTGETMSSSSFVGLRLFLLVGLCFPFLLFELTQRRLLLLGLSFPVLSIVFFDGIFALFQVGYLQNPAHDKFYEFSNVRALISAFAIGASLFMLKLMVENAERMNRNLLQRLEDQNKLIKRQAEADNKAAEEALRESEFKYRSLFEQASEFIGVLDFEGRIRDANESWCKTLGYTKEEMLTMRIDQLIEPQQLKEIPLKIDELRSGKHVFTHRRLVCRDGRIIEVESNSQKFQDDKVLVMGRDATELRKAQRQIEISEARFRGAFEQSAIGMALVSIDGQWMRVNNELSRIVGYMPEELRQMKTSDIIARDEADGDFDLRKLIPENHTEAARSERRCVRKDGMLAWVSVNASLIKDQDSTPLYFVVQVEDITAQRDAEEKLRRYEANIRATINNTDMMIWGVDRNFDTIMFNDPFARHIKLRYGQQVTVGANMFPPLGTEQAEVQQKKWQALLHNALAGERIKMEEQRFGIDFQFSLNPIIEGTEVIGVSIFAEDISERKKRERELSEANKKISELRLMALRSVMSPHFIFNVLNSIQYFIAKNDRFNAINYLSSFSRLVRNILNHSVTDKVTLSEEIEMLQNYVQLELTRFENKFAFSLAVDDDIDAESIVIPSLLIQPHVENAILHGLYNKPVDGKLWIRVHEQEEGLLCFEIEDNGIGRAAAMEIRRQNFMPHNSMGTSITEERLKLINHGHQADFQVEDLVGDGGPAGTRVRIRVPYSLE